MPKIETYNFDENISDNDFLLGTDVDEDNKTKSYKIRTLINKIKAEVELTAFIQVETLPIEDIQLNTIYILPNGDWNYYNGTIWLSNSNRPYKVYTALLTQSGTDAPIAKVLENSMPIDITYSYIGVGIFRGSFPYPSDIPYTKLAIILGKLVGEQMGALYTYDSLGYSGGNIMFNLKTKSNTSTFSNNLLSNTFIEIRVYN